MIRRHVGLFLFMAIIGVLVLACLAVFSERLLDDQSTTAGSLLAIGSPNLPG